MKLEFTPKPNANAKPLFYSDKKWESFAAKYSGLVNVTDEDMPIITHRGKLCQSYRLTWTNGTQNTWVPVSRNGSNGPFISVEKLNENMDGAPITDQAESQI